MGRRIANAIRPNLTIQLVLSVVLGAAAALFPYHNWDALGYIGCATASRTSDANLIHDTAYGALKNVSNFDELAHGRDRERVPRSDWHSNPYHFTEMLPFYSVKALFVLAISYLHRLGVSWVNTGPIISGLSCAAMGVLVAFWVNRYITGPRSTLLWLGVMLVPTVTQTARIFTPDALAAVCAVFAAWLVLEQRQYWRGMSVAVLAVWIRPDYVLFAGLLAIALWRIRRLNLAEAVAVIALALGSYLVLQHFSGNYGWTVLFRQSFQGYLTAPGEYVADTGEVLRTYPHVLLSLIKLQLPEGFLLAYYALGGFLLWSGIDREYKAVLASMLLYGIAHVLVFPSLENRFFGPVTVLVSISFAAAQLKRSADRSRLQQESGIAP